jgi:hypothetical protein
MSAGNTDTNLTASSYSFVPKLIEEEYQNLRSAYQLAVKRERTAPRHEKEDRIAEKEQLERDVNRARTRLDVARKAEREREVLKKVKTEQKERAKEGKGTFHLKRGQLWSERCWHPFGYVSLMQSTIFFGRRKEGSFAQGPIRGASSRRRQTSRQEGYREEAKEGCWKGEEESAVCQGRIFGRRWWWWWWWRRRGREETEEGRLRRRLPPAWAMTLFIIRV